MILIAHSSAGAHSPPYGVLLGSSSTATGPRSCGTALLDGVRGACVPTGVGERSGPGRRDAVWDPRCSVDVEQVVGVVPDHRVDVLFGDPTLEQRLREDAERL